MCYGDDKVLVTAEDNLPIIEVDDTYSGNPLQADFDWLMKVLASSLETVKQVKQDLEKLSESTSVQLKYQLLSAVLQMQVMSYTSTEVQTNIYPTNPYSFTIS